MHELRASGPGKSLFMAGDHLGDIRLAATFAVAGYVPTA
jgi:hypothetical protein